MPRTDLTEIVVLLDRSGSMAIIKSDMEAGYDSFVAAQRILPGECRLTLVQFDSQGIETVYEAQDVRSLRGNLNLVPRGGTPLLDAMCETIDRVGARLGRTPEAERPRQVIFMVITDGEENSSRRFTKEAVQTRVKHQTEAYGWQFTYLGANVDAFSEGSKLGLAAAVSAGYTPDSAKAMLRVASDKIGAMRSSSTPIDYSAYTDEERKRMTEKL